MTKAPYVRVRLKDESQKLKISLNFTMHDTERNIKQYAMYQNNIKLKLNSATQSVDIRYIRFLPINKIVASYHMQFQFQLYFINSKVKSRGQVIIFINLVSQIIKKVSLSKYSVSYLWLVFLNQVNKQCDLVFIQSIVKVRMQCPTCFLRYKVIIRKPQVIPCGHTICSSCLNRAKKCRVCGSAIISDKKYALNFSVMQIIEKNSKEIDKYLKVCFVGSSTTGKTSLIKRLMGNHFIQETVTTIGYDFSFQDRIVDQLQIRYQLWDSAGQEKYRAISPIHYKNADIVAIVYDVAQSASDNKLSYWIQEALRNCPEDVKIVIIGNKIDLVEQNKVFKPIDQNAWRQMQKEGYIHLEVSCKTDLGLNQFWEILDSHLRKKLIQKKISMINFDKQLELIQRKRQKITKIKKNSSVYASRATNYSSCC